MGSIPGTLVAGLIFGLAQVIGGANYGLLVGYILLIIMLAVLVMALAAKCSEGLAALLMIASLIPYYICLWLFRHRIAGSIAFHIES